MCKWGTTSPVEVTVSASYSYTGVARREVKQIDACLAGIVAALNRGGLQTVASCCGHGKEMGSIALADGREIVLRVVEALLVLALLFATPAAAQVFDPDTCWTCRDKMAHAVIGAGLDILVRGPWITKSWRDTAPKRLAWVGVFAVANEVMDWKRPALSGEGNVGVGLIDIVATVSGAVAVEFVAGLIRRANRNGILAK